MIEEIEALHVDLWNAKAAAIEAPAEDGSQPAPDLHRTLADRLRFGRAPADSEA